jgi:hypothetical protein
VLGDTPRQLKLFTAGLAVLGLLLGLGYALALRVDSAGFADLRSRATSPKRATCGCVNTVELAAKRVRAGEEFFSGPDDGWKRSTGGSGIPCRAR